MTPKFLQIFHREKQLKVVDTTAITDTSKDMAPTLVKQLHHIGWIFNNQRCHCNKKFFTEQRERICEHT